ncbi:MAG TPA: ROK family protein, partial [Chloroflexota bacterium]|nr:ROK family protein [Chloroflexota bacterium]
LEVLPVAVTKKPIPIGIRANGAFAVGINLGFTGIGIGVLDLKGEIHALEVVYYTERHDPATVIAQVVETVGRVLAASAVDPTRIIGVGVGVAGVVDPGTGTVRSHLSLGWRDVKLGQLLEQALGRPVTVINNVHAIAVCERLYGVASHAANFVEILVSTIVGAAIVVDGELHRGLEAAAGLIGHTRVVQDGPVCTCGRRGCLEAVASNWALLRDAREAIARGEPTTIQDVEALMAGSVSMVPIYEAAKGGDHLAIELLRRQATYIGSSIASLLYLLDPDLVVVSGPVLDETIDLGGTDFLGIVRETAREQAMLLNVPDSRIQPSRFGLDAVTRGGASIVLDDFLDTAPFAERRRGPLPNGSFKTLR